jgi:hypothetical protein
VVTILLHLLFYSDAASHAARFAVPFTNKAFYRLGQPRLPTFLAQATGRHRHAPLVILVLSQAIISMNCAVHTSCRWRTFAAPGLSSNDSVLNDGGPAHRAYPCVGAIEAAGAGLITFRERHTVPPVGRIPPLHQTGSDRSPVHVLTTDFEPVWVLHGARIWPGMRPGLVERCRKSFWYRDAISPDAGVLR